MFCVFIFGGSNSSQRHTAVWTLRSSTSLSGVCVQLPLLCWGFINRASLFSITIVSILFPESHSASQSGGVFDQDEFVWPWPPASLDASTQHSTDNTGLMRRIIQAKHLTNRHIRKFAAEAARCLCFVGLKVFHHLLLLTVRVIEDEQVFQHHSTAGVNSP